MTVFVLHKGQEDIGTVLIKIARSNRMAFLYSRQRNFDGELEWFNPLGDLHESLAESEADAYIEQTKNFDPDLWVVEVEDFQDGLSRDSLQDLLSCL